MPWQKKSAVGVVLGDTEVEIIAPFQFDTPQQDDLIFTAVETLGQAGTIRIYGSAGLAANPDAIPAWGGGVGWNQLNSDTEGNVPASSTKCSSTIRKYRYLTVRGIDAAAGKTAQVNFVIAWRV